MALDGRIRELDNRHRELDAAIQAEIRRPGVDATRITQMKREKLRLKEQIETLREGRA